MRAIYVLVAAAAAAENDSAWRERLGLAGSACPAECPLRHRSIVNIKDFGRAGFADRQFIIEGVTIMAVSLCARVVLPMPEESFGGHDIETDTSRKGYIRGCLHWLSSRAVRRARRRRRRPWRLKTKRQVKLRYDTARNRGRW